MFDNLQWGFFCLWRIFSWGICKKFLSILKIVEIPYFKQVPRFQKLKDVNSKDSLVHSPSYLRTEHVELSQIKFFFALEKIPSPNVKGPLSSNAAFQLHFSWQDDRFTDEGNSLFPHYITRLSDLSGSPFALGDYSKAWGSNAEVLNLSSGEWSTRESYPYSDWITHYATVSMPNEIMIFGGWDGTLRWCFKVISRSRT